MLEVQAHTTGPGLPMIGSILVLAGEMTIHTELCWTQLMPLMYSSIHFALCHKEWGNSEWRLPNWELSILHSSQLLATIRVLPDARHQGTCLAKIAVLDFHPMSGPVVGT